MSETKPTYALPQLAVELPTAELMLELLSVNGGAICFRTTAAYLITTLAEGIADLEDGDLTRIAELYRAVIGEVRERQNGAKETT